MAPIVEGPEEACNLTIRFGKDIASEHGKRVSVGKTPRRRTISSGSLPPRKIETKYREMTHSTI
jgi:hypothetical protein